MDLKQKHVNNLFDKYRWHVGDTIFSNPRKVLKWFLAAWVLFMVTLFALSCEDNNTDFIDEMLVEQIDDLSIDELKGITIPSETSKASFSYFKILYATKHQVVVFFPKRGTYNFNTDNSRTMFTVDGKDIWFETSRQENGEYAGNEYKWTVLKRYNHGKTKGQYIHIKDKFPTSWILDNVEITNIVSSTTEPDGVDTLTYTVEYDIELLDADPDEFYVEITATNAKTSHSVTLDAVGIDGTKDDGDGYFVASTTNPTILADPDLYTFKLSIFGPGGKAKFYKLN